MLGPLRLTIDGDEVTVPGPKRRALLALLAMADGRAVPVEDLLDALWPSDLPDSAHATLQSHVSRLRGHLGSGADRLEAIGGGYRLLLGPAETDIGCAVDSSPPPRTLLQPRPPASWPRHVPCGGGSRSPSSPRSRRSQRRP